MLNKNEFGELVRAYRKQREWTQRQLAERWEHTQEYVSQVERGQRKVDSTSQLVRLADILDIPQEKLDAIGRGIPERKAKAVQGLEEDHAILQMLLAPGRDMVRFAWIAWSGDQHPRIEGTLRDLSANLEQALIAYNGEFRRPARQLLAYTHQMQGKIAFDRLDYAAAAGHFSEMIDLGREINDAEIIAIGIVQQSDLLRKRGRYENALRSFESAKPFIDASTQDIQCMRHVLMARAYYCYGDEHNFLRSINKALENPTDTIDSIANQITLEDILEEKAAGFTTLNQPQHALEIYKSIDGVFRPMRNQGSYLIDKAQVYFHLSDFERGLKFATEGLHLATTYRSKRQVARLETTYLRLLNTVPGKKKQMRDFQELLLVNKSQQANW